MHPELSRLIAQQRIADMHEEADRWRLARAATSEGQPVRRRIGVAQLFAWLGVARARGGSAKGNATAVSKRLTDEASGVSDVAVARADPS